MFYQIYLFFYIFVWNVKNDSIMEINRKAEQRKKLSITCLIICFILLFVFIFAPKWFIVFPLLFLFASWGFYVDSQRLLRKKPLPIKKNQKKEAYERLVSRYGEPSERIDIKKDRYDGIVDSILIFDKVKHIVLDGLDFEMRDLTDCRLVEDEHRNLYSVIVSVKGFGRSEITLNLEEDAEMAKEIVGRIIEIVQQNKEE